MQNQIKPAPPKYPALLLIPESEDHTSKRVGQFHDNYREIEKQS